MATVVRFVGGPFAGVAEVSQGNAADPVRGSGAIMAEMAHHDYTAHPPKAGDARWVLCRIHSGRSAGPHFYQIVSDQTKADRLELVCEYGGSQYPGTI